MEPACARAARCVPYNEQRLSDDAAATLAPVPERYQVAGHAGPLRACASRNTAAMAWRPAARQLLSCSSSLAPSSGGALQARARAPPRVTRVFARAVCSEGCAAIARVAAALGADAAVPPAQSRFLGQLRPFNATAAARGGAGLPVERGPPVTQEARARAPQRAPAAPPRGPPPQRSRLSRAARPQVPEHDELRWDDGSKNPEMVLDDPAPHLTPVRGAAQRQRACRVARRRGPRPSRRSGLISRRAH